LEVESLKIIAYLIIVRKNAIFFIRKEKLKDVD